MALGSSLLGVAGGGGGNLGTLFITITANSLGVVAGMKQAESAVRVGSSKILAASTKMATGVTAALTAVSAAGIYHFGKFEQAMVESTAIMGDMSDALRDNLEKTARQLATESTTSAEN